jgi:dTDP-4-dehydrorhamnose 3,5-epimerase
MGEKILDNVTFTPLKRIITPGGDVLKILTKKETAFQGFGEAYFSIVLPGSVKAWKLHTKMTLNLVVPDGKIRFVFVDESGAENLFRIEELGEHRYARLTVPPGIWFGFQGIDEKPSILLNIADIIHDPNEAQRRNPSDILFNW